MIRDKSFLVVNGAVFLLMFGVGMIVAELPARLLELSGAVSHVGYLASVFAVSYVLFQVPVGTLSDRMGFKGFLVGGYYLCALTGLLYCFAESEKMILLGRFLQGVGEVPVWQASAMLAVAWPAARGKAVGIYNAAIHLGLTLGAGAGVFLSPLMGSRGGYLLFALASFLGGTLVWALALEPERDREERAFGGMDGGEPASGGMGAGMKELLKTGGLRVWLGIFLYGGGYGVFLTVVPGVLITVNEFAQRDVGAFFTLFYVMVSFAQVIGGTLADRWGTRFLMVACLVAAALGLPFFMKSVKPTAFLFLGISSLGLGGFHVSSMAFLNRNTPDTLKGAVSGAYYLFWGAGYCIFPVLMGQIGGQVGFSLVFRGLALAFCMTGVLLSLPGTGNCGMVKTG